jgi:hypothetical protein
MTIMKNFVLLMAALSTILACNKAVQKPTSIADLQVVINVMETEKLNNREFPLYSLSIYNDYTAYYNGMNKMMKMGSFKRKLTESEYQLFTKMVNTSGSSYQTYAKDPNKTIAVTNEQVKNKKQVKLSEEKLKQLSASIDLLLQNMISNGVWVAPRVSTVEENKANMIPNELLLSLKDEKVLKELLGKFNAYGLSMKRKLSSANNYWLMTFDSTAINMSAMLDLLRLENGVVGVSSNMILSTRE